MQIGASVIGIYQHVRQRLMKARKLPVKLLAQVAEINTDDRWDVYP
jgi:hypothetical protein